ncbi:unnamed protein product [Calypogeia fissa]
MLDHQDIFKLLMQQTFWWSDKRHVARNTDGATRGMSDTVWDCCASPRFGSVSSTFGFCTLPSSLKVPKSFGCSGSGTSSTPPMSWAGATHHLPLRQTQWFPQPRSHASQSEPSSSFPAQSHPQPSVLPSPATSPTPVSVNTAF